MQIDTCTRRACPPAFPWCSWPRRRWRGWEVRWQTGRGPSWWPQSSGRSPRTCSRSRFLTQSWAFGVCGSKVLFKNDFQAIPKIRIIYTSGPGQLKSPVPSQNHLIENAKIPFFHYVKNLKNSHNCPPLFLGRSLLYFGLTLFLSSVRTSLLYLKNELTPDLKRLKNRQTSGSGS